ncbi:uncharacterized protein VTP21DRAFT_7485 [Calcarisporiella thermophila]|uniref:uncharacterized protein n=1 Tax=Calcarisporiella thermophila TaxID=911321 RepID=UPI003742FADB
MPSDCEALVEGENEGLMSTPHSDENPTRAKSSRKNLLIVFFLLIYYVLLLVIYSGVNLGGIFRRSSHYSKNYCRLYSYSGKCYTASDIEYEDLDSEVCLGEKSKILRGECSASIPWNEKVEYTFKGEKSKIRIDVSCLIGGGNVVIKNSNDVFQAGISFHVRASQQELHKKINITAQKNQESDTNNIHVFADSIGPDTSCVNVDITILLSNKTELLEIDYPNANFDISGVQMNTLNLDAYRGKVKAKDLALSSLRVNIRRGDIEFMSTTTDYCSIRTGSDKLKLNISPTNGRNAYYFIESNNLEMKIPRHRYQGSFAITSYDNVNGPAYIGPNHSDLIITRNLTDDISGRVSINGYYQTNQTDSILQIYSSKSFQLNFT